MSLIISRISITLLLFLNLLLSPSTTAQYSYPATIPLAVRSPYLNCWLQANSTLLETLGYKWPTTFNQSEILGLTVFVRVDNQTYLLLGDGDPSHNIPIDPMGILVSPSSTIFAGLAGPMEVNLTFLNPIVPQDWVKQSIPFSYMSFTAKSIDNSSHHVQVYTDISGEWLSGNRTQTILWNSTFNPFYYYYYNVTLQTPAIYTEILDRPEWGTLYFAMDMMEFSSSTQSGSDTDCRGNFSRNGVLNTQDDHSRPISDGLTVFSFAADLLNVSATTPDPVVWAIGYTTDLVINYTDLSGAPPTPRSPYYKTRYSNDNEMVVNFLNDFSNASSRAQELDGKIIQDADSVANDLSSLTSLALAEVYGSMELTVWTDGLGNYNKSDVMVFMKNIGGVEKKVNAVETLYAAFPALMYIDPSLGAPLLEPLFRLQASPNYTVGYAAADLGSNYPSVSGSNSNHGQGVEQTGNMLIMSYAYALASGDGSLISRYYSVLTTWADYLIGYTLFIHNQSSADNLTVSNQTNLAIKGIIAIEAMSKMSSVVKQTVDMNKYSNEAAGLYAKWKSLAVGNDQHVLATYGQSESWTLGYNLFADKWLHTELVNDSIYDGHSDFINNLMTNSNFSHYGMPIDSTDTSATVSIWSLFAAAMTSNSGLRTDLISSVFNLVYMGYQGENTAFAVSYDTANGTLLQGVASPALGAMFAPLALNVPTQTINPDGLPGNMNSPRKKIGTTVGVVIGCFSAVFGVISITTFVRRRRRRARARATMTLSSDFNEASPELTVTPFDPYDYEASQYTIMLAEQQPLVTEGPEAEMLALHCQSSTPLAAIPLPRPGTPVPVVLSDKEIARLRAENNNSQQSRNLGASSPDVPEADVVALHRPSSTPLPTIALPQSGTRIPVELSDREIVRLSAEGNSQQSRNLGVSSSNVLQPTSAPDPVPEIREAPYDPQRLHSEVESLVRREMERLHAEGLVVEVPPPSYATSEAGDV